MSALRMIAAHRALSTTKFALRESGRNVQPVRKFIPVAALNARSNEGTASSPSNGPLSKRDFTRSAVADAAAPAADPAMFCYQCEQTKNGTGCETVGVCGKTPEVSALQDLLLYRLKGLAGVSVYAKEAADITHPEADEHFNKAMFSTLTNVNFDEERFVTYIKDTNVYIRGLKHAIADAGVKPIEVPKVPWFSGVPHPFEWDMKEDSETLETFIDLGHQVGISNRRDLMGNDTLLGLHELITYGVKGAVAYSHHAAVMGKSNPELDTTYQKFMAFLCKPEAEDAMAVLGQALEVGKANLSTMALLEDAHTSNYGHPTPTPVKTTPTAGKCILVSGHDLSDLEAVLKMTEGTGVNVYTHGELLPAHGYPELRKYAHLAGHYGGAWYRQKMDFYAWPGSILITTNCVLDPPEDSYEDNLFTTGETGVEGVRHLAPKDFGPLIERAKELPGFSAEQEVEDGPTHLVGFGRETMLGAAPAVLDAIKAGDLKHIFLIGGCDGSEGSRRYYKKVAALMPQTSAILTLGCAKYRLLGQDYGTIPNTEIPRLLDMGQCNDSYAAVQVAVALAEALGTDVNSLPLSLDISWFEQKAVAVLLSLLHLGVTDIRLGPALPAFLTPAALQILVDAYAIKPATSQGAPMSD
mmetsp:Transcript_20112/g.44028  ORF Transcript_20112/g.44028 Transcript_20112/m.44028 type:complete len:639 (-) Transcript_20112:306-2222(-)